MESNEREGYLLRSCVQLTRTHVAAVSGTDGDIFVFAVRAMLCKRVDGQRRLTPMTGQLGCLAGAAIRLFLYEWI